jgi:ATP-dependent Lon protease
MAEDPEKTQAPALPDRLPVLPLRGTVVFPLMVTPLRVGQVRSLRLVQDLGPGNRILGLFAVRVEQIEQPGPSELYQIGTAANILQLTHLPDGHANLVVQGFKQIRLEEVVK